MLSMEAASLFNGAPSPAWEAGARNGDHLNTSGFLGNDSAQQWELGFGLGQPNGAESDESTDNLFWKEFHVQNSGSSPLAATTANNDKDDFFAGLFDDNFWLTDSDQASASDYDKPNFGPFKPNAVITEMLPLLPLTPTACCNPASLLSPGLPMKEMVFPVSSGLISPPTKVVPIDTLFGHQADSATDILEDLDNEEAAAVLQDFNSYVAGITPPLSPENVDEITLNYSSGQSTSSTPEYNYDYNQSDEAFFARITSSPSSSDTSYEDVTPVASPVPAAAPNKRRRQVQQRPAAPMKKPRLVNMDSRVKKERKKAQNKTAATRYREKKRTEGELMQAELEALESRNKQLHDKATQITSEIAYLKGLMKEVLIAKGVLRD